VAIQRRLIAALGYRCPATGLRDAPPPAAVAGLAPARLASFDLAPKRALALRRAAREVASGRAGLDAAIGDREAADAAIRRLRSIPEIGPWTVEMLALHGLGRFDLVAAGDLGFIKLVGRLLTGDPRARAEVPDVRRWFARYGEWQGLAGEYLRVAAGSGLLTPGRTRPDRVPRPPGTRWSARVPRSAAA